MNRFAQIIVRLTLVASLLTGTLVLAPTATAAPTCATPEPATAAGWQQLVMDTPYANRWYHGDSGQSVQLPDGRRLWVFSDTLSGTVAADGTQQRANQFIHNRAVITDRGCAKQLIGPSRPDGHPTDWVPITAGPSDLPGVNDYYWMSTPFVDGAVVRAFLMHVKPAAGPSGYGFEVVGTDLATFDVTGATPRLVNIRKTPASAAGSTTPIWGSAVVHDGLYTYIFGSRLQPGYLIFGHYHYLARVPRGQIATQNAWRYWTGTGWATQQSKAQAVIPGVEGVGSTTNVYKRPGGGFALVAKQYEFIGTELVAFTAPSLTGPWTRQDPALLSPVPDVRDSEGESTYNGLAHPEIRLPSGQLLVTWNRNSSDPSFFGDPRYGTIFAEVRQP